MGWLAKASAALVAVSSAASAQGQAPATTDGVTDPNVELIELMSDGHNRLTVPVTIGNSGPYDFMIDTGAQATVLSRELADELNLNERQMNTLIGMASRREVETTFVRDFALGMRMFDIATAPLVSQSSIGTASGVLGLDSLQEQRVLFDFEAKTIEVADADTLGGNRGFEIIVRAREKYGQLIITQATVGGIDIDVILSTGAEGSVGNLALLRKLRGKQYTGEAVMTDINGVTEQAAVRLVRDLEIGRGRISTVPLVFMDSPSFAVLGLQDKPAVLLGMSELRLFRRVAIDFKDKRVLFDLPRDAGWIDQPGTTRLAF
jgi:predicted aspartyl protease